MCLVENGVMYVVDVDVHMVGAGVLQIPGMFCIDVFMLICVFIIHCQLCCPVLKYYSVGILDLSCCLWLRV
jgi:hypothetical protein